MTKAIHWWNYPLIHSMSYPIIATFIIIISIIYTINKVITINSNLLFLILPLRLLLAILLPIVTVIASHHPSTTIATYSSPKSSSITTNSTTNNILFILADDMGYGDLSVFPFNQLQCSKTPNLQAMADRGVYIVIIAMIVVLCSFTNIWCICDPLLII